MNFRLALRSLFKAPVLTSVAILSLALGIGANTGIFSLYNQLILRELPVPDPDTLINLNAPGPKQGATSCNQSGNCDAVFSYRMFRDLEAVPTGPARLAGYRIVGANLAHRGGETVSGEAVLVSGGYFQTLGLQPALGRLLGPADDETIGGHFVTVLTYDYWRSRFAQRPDVIGEPLVVNGQPMTIVGVAPEGFTGNTLASRPLAFVPLTMRGVMTTGFNSFEDRRNYWVYVFGRLNDGATIAQTEAALNATYRQIITEVEVPLQQGMSDTTLARFRERTLEVLEGSRGQSNLHREARTPLLLLLTVTGIVLVIACANVANLLLSRAASRGREMSIRRSLGANRVQLLLQMLTESAILGAIGGIVGLGVARATLSVIVSFLPPEGVAAVDLRLDPAVLAFAALLSLLTALLVGLYPAWHGSGTDLMSGLRSSSGQAGGGRAVSRFRTSLATMQIALAMALLVSASLFTRSLVNVSRIDLGIDQTDLVTFRLSPVLNGYQPQESRTLFARVEEELAALPGVTLVSAGRIPLIADNNTNTNVSVQGFDAGPDTNTSAAINEVGTRYFETVGMALRSGREFGPSDASGAPLVAIVNETFAARFNLGRDAVSKRMAIGRRDELDRLIVGVVADARYSSVRQEVPPQVFIPYRQNDQLGSLSFYVRAPGAERATLSAIAGVVRRIDSNLPVEDLKTMTRQIEENLVIDRVVTTLATAFAILATALAAVGLYGVLSYMVGQRTREIGVRIALGATESAIRRLVLGKVGLMVLVGMTVGIAGALGVGRLASSVLYEVQPYDPIALAAAAAMVVAVAMAAGVVPARRASRVNPVSALRQE